MIIAQDKLSKVAHVNVLNNIIYPLLHRSLVSEPSASVGRFQDLFRKLEVHEAQLVLGGCLLRRELLVIVFIFTRADGCLEIAPFAGRRRARRAAMLLPFTDVYALSGPERFVS